MRIVLRDSSGATIIFENGTWHAQPRDIEQFLNKFFHPAAFAGHGGDGAQIAVDKISRVFAHVTLVSIEHETHGGPGALPGATV